MSPESTSSLTNALVLRGQVDGREQFDQGLLVLRAGVLLQGLAERLILDARRRRPGSGRRWPGRRRDVRVAAVLGQMETDPPHLMPERGPLLQEAGQSLATGGNLAADPGVEIFPDADQGRVAQVFSTLHRRNIGQYGRPFLGVGRGDCRRGRRG